MGLNENIFWKQNSDTDLDLVELGVGRDQQLLSGSVRVRQMDKQGLFSILLSNVVVRVFFIGADPDLFGSVAPDPDSESGPRSLK